MKRVISGILCILLGVMTLTGIHVPVMAEEAQSTTATRGVYWFSPHEVETDLTDSYIYDDALLKGDSLAYNKQLATMTFELAIESISSMREPKTAEGYANKSRNLRAYLEDNGFVDFDTNDFYTQKPTTTSMGAACAHKKIVDDGKEYTLLAIVPRSAGYESEWAGNFMIGETGDHEGFKLGKDIVLAFAKEYVERYGITGDIKVWTSGYSRGAGVTNQVGAALIQDPKAALGENINLEPGNLYCYTFGTPNSAQDPVGDYGAYDDPAFAYIHNTWEPYDIVTIAPPQPFGFNRYGTNTGYTSPENKERMLSFLQVTNQVIYDSYMKNADPDNFRPYQVDLMALLEKKINMIPDEESYLPTNQADYLELMAGSVVEAIRYDDKTGNADPRTTYYNKYQGPISRLTGYIFSHTDKVSTIVDSIKGSNFAIPLAIVMYLTYLAEMHRNTTYNAAEINELITDLNTYIDADGETVPQEIKDLLTGLEDLKKEADGFDDFVDVARLLTGTLYAQVIGDALTAAGLNTEDPALYAQITDVNTDGIPVSRILSYMLLSDIAQTPGVNFDAINEQFKHLATFIGNARSYMRPHNNEIILSWLRAQDPSYDDFVKEDTARKSGYRRAYIPRPEGVTVSGIVKDESGNTVAEFADGEITSRTDPWLGITTSDNGNWLRLPLDKTYSIELKTDKETSLDLKITEYDVYSHTEVRTEASEGIAVRPSDTVTWLISAVTDGAYTLPSAASYSLDITRMFKISYDLGGGTLDGQTGVIEEEFVENTVIELPKPVRDGYTFDYWDGSKYQAGDSYTVTEDHVFTAKWKKNSKPGDDPDKPDTPDKPDKPDTPDKPDNPDNPDKPDNPVNPVKPDPAKGPTAPDKSGSNIKTGDDQQPILWVVLLVASLSVSAGSVIVYRKKKGR